MSYLKQLLFVLFFAVALFFLGTALSSPTVSALDLPPRPTVMPTATPAAVVDSTFVGGTIQLHLTDETEDTTALWTAVQWQDANEGWHTVEGWQGTFNPDGTVTWWVAPENLATGPFRWQLFATENGDLLAESESFYLPTNNGQVLQVAITK